MDDAQRRGATIIGAWGEKRLLGQKSRSWQLRVSEHTSQDDFKFSFKFGLRTEARGDL